MERLGLLLAFDTDEEEFARGFEAGRIWALLRAAPEETVAETVSAGNAEMFIRMAEATCRPVSCRELADDWLEVTFEPAESA